MNTKKILILALLIVSNYSFSQGFALEIAYKNVGGNHLEIGTTYRLSENKNEDRNPLNINAAIITNFKNEFVPKIGIHKRIYKFFEAGFNGSSKYAEQTLGINFMNALKLNLGYTIPYKANYFKGLTLGLSISFSKSNGYYDHLKIGF
ncbi:hypothetical protein [Flavobacterium sp.]|uniref:hypothetical protein n=1 Tax=Flavobacterium sp. TaxID=239 RepID=UPI002609BEFB|nr:hypothetical protein [Flavobacterium sp.]